MTKIIRTIIAATASLGLLLSLTRCGSVEDEIRKTVPENVTEEPAEADEDVDAESDTDDDSDDDSQASTGEGEDPTGIEEAEPPSEWPRDLPLPKDHLRRSQRLRKDARNHSRLRCSGRC